MGALFGKHLTNYMLFPLQDNKKMMVPQSSVTQNLKNELQVHIFARSMLIPNIILSTIT